MSGKPQYDETAAVEAAMKVFWRNGYAAASINDLTAATGLSRSSIYQRFEDKDGLFREALNHYTDRVLRRMNAVGGATPRERMEALLRDLLHKRAAAPDGCMLARSCVEKANLPKASQSAVTFSVGRQRAVLTEIIDEGVARGKLSSDVDREALAWHYLGVLHAVMNLPQAGATPAALSAMVDLAMSAWPPGVASQAD
ncbi:TetR/AcrR family transcriptional regulator [Caballeronia sp. GAWG1-5s-s]|uniref:TetR/AcrR family transcriptional regulator n=1 Tax=Caballeronia sp. GAWG1-5s-s TaxID=2921743 RepID=UPI0020286420|nr:TetR/AcrR family transcriptional regulator [Caballeronia sp. GAWG1-5s-s]